MTPGPKQDFSSQDANLLTIPPELITKIIAHLPSFIDVFAVAASCHQLRYIYTTNTTTIYAAIAPRVIPCERDARQVLAAQDGPGVDDAILTTKDIAQIVNNVQRVKKAIYQFEKQIVQYVKTGGHDTDRWYGDYSPSHPPFLTDSERHRFTKTYYLLWTLMRLDPSEWSSRLAPLTLRRLYYLHELTHLTQPIGWEEEIPPPPPHLELQKRDLYSAAGINHQTSSKRDSLRGAIWARIEDIFERFHNCGAHPVEAYSLEDGALGFVVLWDHWQKDLRSLVLMRRVTGKRPVTGEERRFLWDESEDEGGVV